MPSASLILDDPTLLFVNAGMVQFKPYFLGEAPAPYPRATSIQKCVRTGDIDEVGKTTRHNTFFQMAGNFSFGDYFKAGAIEHAWNLVTGSQDDGGYGFDPDRIWVTVYHDDDEAVELWQRIAGLPRRAHPAPRRQGQLLGHGRARSRRPLLGDLLRPRARARPRRRPGRRRGPLPGDLEPGLHAGRPRRAVARRTGTRRSASCRARTSTPAWASSASPPCCRASDNVYETDLVRPVIARAEELSGRRYGANPVDDVRFRVIADHARSGVMIIGDGVTPGNEGRGYVLRRLLRRIVRSARLLGVTEPVLASFAEVVRDAMSPSYPELTTDFERISAIVRTEEEAFLRHAHRRLADLRHGRRRDEAGRAARCWPATRPSSCTTRTASRSTSPWRWRPRPG